MGVLDASVDARPVGLAPPPLTPPRWGGVKSGSRREHAIKRLVWLEQHPTMQPAIAREKRIKTLELIERDNLGWRDLAEDLGSAPLEPSGSPLSRG